MMNDEGSREGTAWLNLQPGTVNSSVPTEVMFVDPAMEAGLDAAFVAGGGAGLFGGAGGDHAPLDHAEAEARVVHRRVGDGVDGSDREHHHAKESDGDGLGACHLDLLCRCCCSPLSS
ncbi:unnamed protein product [Musa hybrid cultivar]